MIVVVVLLLLLWLILVLVLLVILVRGAAVAGGLSLGCVQLHRQQTHIKQEETRPDVVKTGDALRGPGHKVSWKLDQSLSLFLRFDMEQH